ncbi:MAG: hemolysin III family protein [Actinomycetota bacterium]|nr:hemolysin III family protein [Actinomycetota bacterium]
MPRSPEATFPETLPAPLREVLEAVRPRLRGRLHQVAFFLSIPAGIVIVAVAQGPTARIGAAVYALSLTALFATSAAYHRSAQSIRARLWMRRLDHAMIFVLIAGSYTPVCLVALDGVWRVASLSVVWAGALVGVALKLFRLEAMRLGNSLYIVLGWSVLVLVPQLRGRPLVLGLLGAGGLIYTVGAVVLTRRSPDPLPAVFGYHEVWHCLVVVACACHYAMILLLVRSA